MHKYDSSLYRVKPLMEILTNEPSYVNRLLSLLEIAPVHTPKSENFYYGSKEKGLKQSKQYLINLIDYIKDSRDNSKYRTNNRNRIELFNGSQKEKLKKANEAKALIEKSYRSLPPHSRDWFIFEESTFPDIFIEGDNYIIICEGKWTEPHVTLETTNLKKAAGDSRSQMIRHIQGAINYNSHKKIYAFYIVDDACNYKGDLTKEALGSQIKNESITIPDSQKRLIKKSFYGYITWQKIEKEFKDNKLHFLTKEEIDILN